MASGFKKLIFVMTVWFLMFSQAHAYVPRTEFAGSIKVDDQLAAVSFRSEGVLLAANVDKPKKGLIKRFIKKYSKRSTKVGRFVRALSYRPREITAAHAARMIKADDHVWIPIGHQVPSSIISSLAERVKKEPSINAEHPVRLVGLSNVMSRRIFDRAGKVQPQSLFIGGNVRDAVMAGRGAFTPIFLSRVPRMIEEGNIKVDKAIIQVSAPDKFGFVTLGASAAASLSAIKKAKLVIAEVNPNVPRTNGVSKFHISQIDAIVKSNKTQKALPEPQIGATEKAIAKHIVKLIPEKPTLQFGIGAIPDAVAGLLAKSGRKDLRVHSEMISDGVMNLEKAGAIKGKVKYSFAMGSDKMLKWLDKNKKLRSYTTDQINNPAKLVKIPRLVSVNSALRVDLRGQVNAQYIKDTWYSGVGGQVDFFRGAMGSKGGRAILALPSTTTLKNGKRISRIVPALGKGDIVTTSMHDLQYVVTEHGVAHLDGKNAVERARALIGIAAPEFRKDLTAKLDAQLKARKAAEQQKYDAYVANKKQ